MLVFVRNNIVSAAVILLAAHAAAQPSAPATAQKPAEAVKSIARPSESASKSGQDRTEPRSDNQKESPRITSSPAAGAAAPGASETKAEPAEGLRVAPVGRRDPFRPITLNVRANVRRRENLSPLERYELGQLNLVGIVWDIKEPTAMVEDSSGLGYVVKVGTLIGSNDGKVKEIKRDGLIIEELFVDLYGAKKRREVSMRLAVEQ